MLANAPIPGRMGLHSFTSTAAGPGNPSTGSAGGNSTPNLFWEFLSQF